MPRFLRPGANLTVPGGVSGAINVIPDNSYNGSSPSQTGLLLMCKDAQTGKDCDSVKGKSLQTDEALQPLPVSTGQRRRLRTASATADS